MFYAIVSSKVMQVNFPAIAASYDSASCQKKGQWRRKVVDFFDGSDEL